MPESRDRRQQPVDIAAAFTRRRSGGIGILDDELDSALFRFTPSRMNTAWTGSGQEAGLGGTRVEGSVIGVFGNIRSGSPIVDRNSPSWADRWRRLPSRSVLPSWYPRTPLRDITAVVRAIDRRRVGLEESRVEQPMSPSPVAVEQTPAKSMNPTISLKLRTPSSKLPKILLEITNQFDEGSEFLTPQKKLLNSIDMVEKVVKEELQKLKRTPSAKKADREKRVRTLMSMR